MGASGFYAGSESEIIAKTKPIPAENVAQPYISQPTLTPAKAMSAIAHATSFSCLVCI